MLKYENNNGIAELIIEGTITTGDIDRVADAMNADIEQYGELRVLEEFRDFDGIDPIALWKDAKFGVKQFNKLTYIAVIAKPKWVQTIASAVEQILPGKVKVFEPAQIDTARQWLRTAPEPHQDSKLAYKSHANSNMVEIVVAGKITGADYDRMLPQFKADLAQHGQLKVLEEVRSFEGMDPIALWKDLKQIPLAKKITHVALVADAQWLRTLADTVGAVMPSEIRSFERSQIEQARAWLANC